METERQIETVFIQTQTVFQQTETLFSSLNEEVLVDAQNSMKKHKKNKQEIDQLQHSLYKQKKEQRISEIEHEEKLKYYKDKKRELLEQLREMKEEIKNNNVEREKRVMERTFQKEKTTLLSTKDKMEQKLVKLQGKKNCYGVGSRWEFPNLKGTTRFNTLDNPCSSFFLYTISTHN